MLTKRFVWLRFVWLRWRSSGSPLFCFFLSATFKPHGGKQPPPHHRPPIPPFFFFSVPNAAEKEEADASEPAVLLLSLFL